MGYNTAKPKRIKGASAPRKRTPAKPKDNRWTPSELVYAIYGYLTTRKSPVIMGGSINASATAEILGAIMDENGIEGPGNDYPDIKVGWAEAITQTGYDVIETESYDKIKSEAEANRNSLQIDATNAGNADPVAAIMQVFNGYGFEAQNNVLALVIEQMAKDRKAHYKSLEEMRADINNKVDSFHKQMETFVKISPNL